jgi:hypothetical protein
VASLTTVLPLTGVIRRVRDEARMSLFRAHMVASTPVSKFVRVASRELAKGEIPLISTKVPGSWTRLGSAGCVIA